MPLGYRALVPAHLRLVPGHRALPDRSLAARRRHLQPCHPHTRRAQPSLPRRPPGPRQYRSQTHRPRRTGLPWPSRIVGRAWRAPVAAAPAAWQPEASPECWPNRRSSLRRRRRSHCSPTC